MAWCEPEWDDLYPRYGQFTWAPHHRCNGTCGKQQESVGGYDRGPHTTDVINTILSQHQLAFYLTGDRAMTTTWRQVLVWVEDGHYDRSSNGRKSRAKDKPRARRAQRRQHAKIIEKAVREYHLEEEFNLNEVMLQDLDDNFGMMDMIEEMEHERWLNEGREDDRYDYSDPYEDYYYDPMDHDEWPITTEPMAAVVRPHDVGKTLGEILEEALERHALGI